MCLLGVDRANPHSERLWALEWPKNPEKQAKTGTFGTKTKENCGKTDFSC
jgi:hypothetical protein